MTDLKPCPSCGYSEPELFDMAEHDYIRNGNRYWVGCRKCGYVKLSDGDESMSPTAEEAIKHWNGITEEMEIDE